jgi:predicted Zn-dependent peptidase
MNALQVIELAQKHVDCAEMRSSAELCLADAMALYAQGGEVNERFAKARALRSLAYSVGAFSKTYKEASAE